MGSDNNEDSEVESSLKDEHELSIGPQAQGPSSQRASPSREFDPSVSQVWSSPTSSLDCEALRRFRDWEPSSQISQFVNDLNYVPTDLPPLNVLGYHEKEDTKGGKDGEQCKPENVDEELVFHEVSFPNPDPSQELSDGPGHSTALPDSLSSSPSSFQHPSHHGNTVTARTREHARKKALQLSKEINMLSSLWARLMRKHRKLVMISQLQDDLD